MLRRTYLRGHLAVSRFMIQVTQTRGKKVHFVPIRDLSCCRTILDFICSQASRVILYLLAIPTFLGAEKLGGRRTETKP